MKVFSLVVFVLFLSSCVLQKDVERLVNQKDVERIIRTLAADDMKGRAVFSAGIEKAAKFIEAEFQAIGLQPLDGLSDFRQDFSMLNISPSLISATVNAEPVEEDNIVVVTDQPALNWTQASGVAVHYIKEGESFTSRYGDIMKQGKPAVVFVANEFVSSFKQMHRYFMGDRVVKEQVKKPEMVFILGAPDVSEFNIQFDNKIEKSPLFNVAGVIPGKTNADEYVIFSGHYDHIGIIEEAAGDSIANGADDDASGVTAVITLARYFKKLNNNARTLIFVAFTGEESGMLGSQYFSTQLKPEQVTAMFNIEMIGKQSKFGPNTAFITGFERSDFGAILQRNLSGTGFAFHPDPYQAQNLFYRSDNASLAELGVPAHTISTVQIDQDKYYHTVDDEVETLNIGNITATIKAIALSSRSIVDAVETPKRVALRERRTP